MEYVTSGMTSYNKIFLLRFQNLRAHLEGIRYKVHEMRLHTEKSFRNIVNLNQIWIVIAIF